MTDKSFPQNLVLLITDQERAHDLGFADNFDSNLPATSWLSQNGLSFSNAFTNTNQCSVARTSFFTSKYPAQHEVKEVITSDKWLNPQTQAQTGLNPDIPNFATMLAKEGYDVIYKGKAHMNIGFNQNEGTANTSDDTYIDPDLSLLGFNEWDPPEAGTFSNPLGLTNDQRFTNDGITWLEDRIESGNEKPFALVISLVNPHDILAYPPLGQALAIGNEDYRYNIEDFLNLDFSSKQPVPETINEDLANNYKPDVQTEFLEIMDELFAPVDGSISANSINYLNFYANLIRQTDLQFEQIIETINSDKELASDTMIVKMSDHGELGLAHGGMRQKTFNAYDEAIKTPLIWSNEEYFEGRKSDSDSLVSHIDFLPTYLSLIGVDENTIESYDLQGVDYSGIINGSNEDSEAQDYILFTWDDDWAGQDPPSGGAEDPQLGITNPPSKIQALRTKEYKLVRYYDQSKPYTDQVYQEEFYDLRPNGTNYSEEQKQPLESINYSPWAEAQRVEAGETKIAPKEITDEYLILSSQLDLAIKERLQSMPGLPGVEPTIATKLLENGLREDVFYIHDGPGELSKDLEIAFNSRDDQFYNIQYLNSYDEWTNIGGDDNIIKGTNNPIYLYYKGLPTDIIKENIRVEWIKDSTNLPTKEIATHGVAPEAIVNLSDGPDKLTKDIEVSFVPNDGQYYNVQYLDTYLDDDTGALVESWTIIGGGAIQGGTKPIHLSYKGLPANLREKEIRVAWVGSSNDPPSVGSVQKTYNGTNKNDRIIDIFSSSGSGESNDLFKGLEGDDIIFAGRGNDYLYGGKGDDTLIGGQGDDRLNGGKGSDMFTLSPGKDVIEDFEIFNSDRILVEENVELLFEQIGQDLLIKGNGGIETTLLNVDQYSLMLFHPIDTI
ncbi:MAG: sulfatase-like hydrolase/transferase [Prochlorococcaceae cyanobacterium ETNP14_MAG_4]|nr:sulfatase-like hydrolase/transferase [Prochlorococcaceae cyanobacterium ETNP14_MAG_4]